MQTAKRLSHPGYWEDQYISMPETNFQETSFTQYLLAELQETRFSNLHLQLSSLKHFDLDPPYSINNPASQVYLLTVDSSHLKDHVEKKQSLNKLPVFSCGILSMSLFL